MDLSRKNEEQLDKIKVVYQIIGKPNKTYMLDDNEQAYRENVVEPELRRQEDRDYEDRQAQSE